MFFGFVADSSPRPRDVSDATTVKPGDYENGAREKFCCLGTFFFSRSTGDVDSEIREEAPSVCARVCVELRVLIKKKTIKTEKPRKMVKAETGDW